MANFSKWNQPKHRGGRPLDPNSKAGQRRAEMARKEREREEAAFINFEKSESGYFSGFDFVNLFHKNYNKEYAIESLESDDCAEAVTSKGATIHAGADGIIVYVMTESALYGDVKKRVEFNRSVYVF